MRVIILAAGEGTRLRPHTADRPKCLVELAGKSLLQHQLDTLAAAGLEDVTVVTGYRADQIERLGRPTRHNPAYDRTNMVASLMCATDQLDGADDVLVLYSDVLYGTDVLHALIACPEGLAAAVNLDWLDLWRLRMDDPLADAETLKIDADGCIVELGKTPTSLDDIQGQYMGLMKFAAATCPQLVAHHAALDAQGPYDGRDRDNMFMTSFLQGLVDSGHPMKAVSVHGGWLEVDSVEDLKLYEGLQARGELGRFWTPVRSGGPTA